MTARKLNIRRSGNTAVVYFTESEFGGSMYHALYIPLKDFGEFRRQVQEFDIMSIVEDRRKELQMELEEYDR